MAQRGVNIAIIIGNIGQQPERRVTGGGSAVVTFSVATSETWKDKNTGQQQERTEWHNMKAFGKLADIIHEYANKGDKVFCKGANRTSHWDDQQTGKKMQRTEIVVEEFQFVSPKQSNNDPALHASGNRQQTNPTYTPPAPAPQAPQGGQMDQFHDDDIPF